MENVSSSAKVRTGPEPGHRERTFLEKPSRFRRCRWIGTSYRAQHATAELFTWSLWRWDTSPASTSRTVPACSTSVRFPELPLRSGVTWNPTAGPPPCPLRRVPREDEIVPLDVRLVARPAGAVLHLVRRLPVDEPAEPPPAGGGVLLRVFHHELEPLRFARHEGVVELGGLRPFPRQLRQDRAVREGELLRPERLHCDVVPKDHTDLVLVVPLGGGDDLPVAVPLRDRDPARGRCDLRGSGRERGKEKSRGGEQGNNGRGDVSHGILLFG